MAMIAQWYEVPADQESWELRLDSLPRPEGDPREMVIFVEDPAAGDGEDQAEPFALEVALGYGEPDLETVGAGEPVNPDLPGRALYAAGVLAENVRGLAARMRKAPGRPLRLFVGVITRILPKEPCELCMELVTLAIRAARVAGARTGGEDAIDMAEGAGFAPPQRIAHFLDRALGEGAVWDHIGDIARSAGDAFRRLDRLARRVCEELGHCEPSEAA